MVFLIGTEGDDHGSGRVDVGAVCMGHAIDFSTFFLSESSGYEYIENAGEGQKVTIYYWIAAPLSKASLWQ